MKVEFIGVGEAFDSNNVNTSILVHSDTKMLLDCGFGVLHKFSGLYKDADFLDAVYISHFHGDHVSGLPALFLWLWEGGRKRDLELICEKGNAEKVETLLNLVYPNFKEKFEYEILYKEVGVGENIDYNELKLSFERTKHSTNNLAIKVDDSEKSFCYSGDGMFTEDTLRMYKGSDLVIQESYMLDKEIIGHASIRGSVGQIESKKLALVHINRHLRAESIDEIRDYISSSGKDVIVPECGDVVEL